MVKRGHEVDIEYSKQEIMDKMNNFFGYSVVEKLKFTSFNDETEISNVETQTINVTNNKFKEKIKDVKNDKLKKSLAELTRVFREK